MENSSDSQIKPTTLVDYFGTATRDLSYGCVDLLRFRIGRDLQSTRVKAWNLLDICQ